MTNNDAGLAENQMIFERDKTRAELESRFRRLLSEHGAALGRLAGSYTRSTSDRDDLFARYSRASSQRKGKGRKPSWNT